MAVAAVFVILQWHIYVGGIGGHWFQTRFTKRCNHVAMKKEELAQKLIYMY